MNRKQRKEAKRMKIAYLKSIVKRPDLCEGWDVTAPDPILLLFLKAYKNTVQVDIIFKYFKIIGSSALESEKEIFAKQKRSFETAFQTSRLH